MKTKIIIYLSGIFIAFSIAQTSKEIKFVIISDNIPDSSSVYITGNHPLLGNWNAGAVILKKLNNTEWSGWFFLPEGFHLEYKLTLGSWEQEALDVNGYVPSNSMLDIRNDTTITIRIDDWGNSRINRVITGQITGTVKYHHKLKGDGIRERDIAVWLPPAYDENPEQRYPVLYMHDGQNMFDPNTSAFGVDWQIDEAADTLIILEYIDPIIIVGIYNTPDRSKEYTPDLTGSAYMNFIVNNLKPFIDSTYKTLPGRKFTTTGGSSLGGLISFMLLWVHSDVFSQAACISPAFKYSTIDFVSQVKNYTGRKKQLRIYIDNGSVGMDNPLQRGVDEMISALQEKGYTEDGNLYYYKALGAKHFESDWAERIWRPLIFMFGKANTVNYIQEK